MPVRVRSMEGLGRSRDAVPGDLLEFLIAYHTDAGARLLCCSYRCLDRFVVGLRRWNYVNEHLFSQLFFSQESALQSRALYGSPVYAVGWEFRHLEFYDDLRHG